MIGALLKGSIINIHMHSVSCVFVRFCSLPLLLGKKKKKKGYAQLTPSRHFINVKQNFKQFV